MKDNLKDFITHHRADFDDQLPPELWASISSGINAPSQSFINLKEFGKMFKYGFGASALIIGTFFILQSLKLNQVSVQSNEQKFPKEKIQTLVHHSPVQTQIKTEPSSVLNEARSIKQTTENNSTKKPIVAQATHTAPSSEAEHMANPKTNPLRGSMISHPSPVVSADSLVAKVEYEMDTLFKGVKNLIVNGTFCKVNIFGKIRPDVSFKANVSKNAGSLIVLGKTVIKKEEAKIKYSLKDSTLTVWIEMQKLEHKERSKKVFNEKSELNFEVPFNTNISVKNHSGDIQVKNITDPIMTLESSFGEVNAENINSDVFVKVSSGDIHLNGINGHLQTNSSFGKQIIGDVKGNIKVTSSSGDITINKLQGNADVTSSFGFQKFENVVGNINSVAASGDLEIDHLTGNLFTKTSFGKQHIENIDGNVTASASSGDIRLVRAKGTFILKTTFGNIHGRAVELLSNSDFTSSSGDISMELLNDISELSFDLASSSGDLEVKKGSFETKSEKKLFYDKGPIKIKGTSSFGNQTYK